MALTALDVSQSPSNQPNIVMNGGMDIWQRGTNFVASLTLAYTADRWQINTDESTNVTISRETTTVDRGLYAMKFVVTSAGASKFYRIRQQVENHAEYRQRTVTLTARVNTNVANAFKIALGDESAIQARSAYHSGSGQWETLSVTYTYGGSIAELKVFTGMLDAGDKKNGTYYLDNVMMVIGSAPATFVSVDPALEMTRCQRYYEISSSLILYVTAIEHSGTANNLYLNAPFKVTKRATPTFTATKVGIFLYHTPTTGNAGITDTANWSFGGGVADTQGQQYILLNRSAGDQTTYSVIEVQWSWIADAEF